MLPAASPAAASPAWQQHSPLGAMQSVAKPAGGEAAMRRHVWGQDGDSSSSSDDDDAEVRTGLPPCCYS